MFDMRTALLMAKRGEREPGERGERHGWRSPGTGRRSLFQGQAAVGLAQAG